MSQSYADQQKDLNEFKRFAQRPYNQLQNYDYRNVNNPNRYQQVELLNSSAEEYLVRDATANSLVPQLFVQTSAEDAKIATPEEENVFAMAPPRQTRERQENSPQQQQGEQRNNNEQFSAAVNAAEYINFLTGQTTFNCNQTTFNGNQPSFHDSLNSSNCSQLLSVPGMRSNERIPECPKQPATKPPRPVLTQCLSVSIKYPELQFNVMEFNEAETEEAKNASDKPETAELETDWKQEEEIGEQNYEETRVAYVAENLNKSEDQQNIEEISTRTSCESILQIDLQQKQATSNQETFADLEQQQHGLTREPRFYYNAPPPAAAKFMQPPLLYSRMPTPSFVPTPSLVPRYYQYPPSPLVPPPGLQQYTGYNNVTTDQQYAVPSPRIIDNLYSCNRVNNDNIMALNPHLAQTIAQNNPFVRYHPVPPIPSNTPSNILSNGLTQNNNPFNNPFARFHPVPPTAAPTPANGATERRQNQKQTKNSPLCGFMPSSWCNGL